MGDDGLFFHDQIAPCLFCSLRYLFGSFSAESFFGRIGENPQMIKTGFLNKGEKTMKLRGCFTGKPVMREVRRARSGMTARRAPAIPDQVAVARRFMAARMSSSMCWIGTSR
jgi:hypothetical protein